MVKSSFLLLLLLLLIAVHRSTRRALLWHFRKYLQCALTIIPSP